MTRSVATVPELHGYQIEWAEPGNYYLSRRNVLYHSKDLKKPFTEVGRVTVPFWKAAAANFRLAQRLFRFFFYNVIPLRNGEIFVTFDKTVGVFRNGKYVSLGGLFRPCRVLRSGCGVDQHGDVYFGEYLANDDRGEMRVYRYRPGRDTVEIAHSFPAGSIKHIHGLYFDKYTDSVWCLTGDKPAECQMLRTTDGFITVETVGSGDETWRAVSVLFTPDHFYYGTDAEYRDNEIFKVDRQTLERTSLGQVSGTVFYAKQIGNDLFFGTTAENAPSQKENVAAVWHIGPSGKIEKIAEYPKDMWHAGLFLFGTIHFPASNDLENRLFFNTVAVKSDNSTHIIS
jgi:hypothetical protein